MTNQIGIAVEKAGMSAKILKEHQSFIELITGISEATDSEKLTAITEMSTPQIVALLELLTNMYYGVLPLSAEEIKKIKPHKQLINTLINKGNIDNKTAGIKQHAPVVLQILTAAKKNLNSLWH